MNLSVNELQNRLASSVDQSSTAPTTAGADWNLRLKYFNMAQSEWAELYDWQALYKEYNTLTSTNTANCSISLPTDFRKWAGYPKITYDSISTKEFAEIRPQEKERYSSSDRYVYLMGNPNANYTMFVHPGTTTGYLTSGASIFLSYYASAVSLVSPADVSMCPNPDYLVTRAKAYLWEAREDGRSNQARAEADKILQRMLEFENVHSEASTNDRVKTVEETRYSFRIGRN